MLTFESQSLSHPELIRTWNNHTSPVENIALNDSLFFILFFQKLYILSDFFFFQVILVIWNYVQKFHQATYDNK